MGRKSHCVRGHERTVQNVMKSGACRRCHNQANQRRKRLQQRAANRRGRQAVMRVEWEPIARVMERNDITHGNIADAMGVTRMSVQQLVSRAKREGRLTMDAADRLCIALGRHPAEVYGPAWFEEVPRAV